MTPTALSLRLLRREGFTVDICERWVPIPGKNIKRDLFGFGDLLGVRAEGKRFLIVQATSRGHVSHRLQKARKLPSLAAWLNAGGLFEVHGWSKRDGRHMVRRVAVAAGEVEPVELSPRLKRRSQKQAAGLFDAF